jgi:hypothetical protein
MGLTSGTKLGPDEIQFALGAGGIGELYRATPGCERRVAIRIVPARLSSFLFPLSSFLLQFRTEGAVRAGSAGDLLAESSPNGADSVS